MIVECHVYFLTGIRACNSACQLTTTTMLAEVTVSPLPVSSLIMRNRWPSRETLVALSSWPRLLNPA